MSMEEKETFCLQQKNFALNTLTVWQELQNDHHYCDVTLACGGNQIQAHQVILASCSPVLKNLLQLSSDHQQPLVYLWGVEFSNLVRLLDYMYQGVVNISHTDLNSFLGLAQELEVKGLMAEEAEEKMVVAKPSEDVDSKEKLPFDPNPGQESFDDINDEPMHDAVPLNLKTEESTEKLSDYDDDIGALGVDDKIGLDQIERVNWKDFKDGHRYSCLQCNQTFTQSGSLKRHIKSIHEGLRYSCGQCEYKATTKGHLKIHVQSIHEKIRYSCHYCEYKGTNKSNLKKHTETVHDLGSCSLTDMVSKQHQVINNHDQVSQKPSYTA